MFSHRMCNIPSLWKQIYIRRLANSALLLSKDKERLQILDTTLRDGEQSPGISLNSNEKLDIAMKLSLMGVDVCEAGFPAALPGEFKTVKRIATEIGPLENGRSIGPMIISCLSRADPKEIEMSFDAVKYAPKHRIHTFIATSDIHLKHKTYLSREMCINQAVTAVRCAASLTEDVEFSAEDATRSDPEFLIEILDRVVDAGAKTINIPDTVGYMLPEEYGSLIKYVKENMKRGKNVVLSTHCHNDLGVATANTLTGVQNGARQVEVTIHGIGERAGNASLEEVVMALKTRPCQFPIFTNIDTTKIISTSNLVSAYTGMVIPSNKAIVGENAFSHESGIHQDGVLKFPGNYEIINPKDIGLSGNRILLGKLSGKHGLFNRLNELGYPTLSTVKKEALFKKFKSIADEKKHISDSDIRKLFLSSI